MRESGTKKKSETKNTENKREKRENQSQNSLSQLVYPPISTMGVPSKFSTAFSPPACSPEFPERVAAGGKIDCPGNELDVVSGSADSATCEAVAFLVRLSRGK